MGRKRVWPPKPAANKGRERVWWQGAWHDLGPAGSDAARAKYGRLLALWAVDPGARDRRADDYLVSELCADYRASAACPGERRQLERVVRAVGLLLDHHLATPVAEFGGADLEAWQGHLCRLADPAGRPLFNRTQVRDLVAVVRRVWKWGVRNKRTTWDQYHELRTVPPPRHGECREPEPVMAADPAAVAAALKHLRPPTRAMVRLQQSTGARPDELCHLRPADVLRAGRVELPGVGFVDLDREGVWVYLPPKHKKAHLRKPRWVVFGPADQAVLAPFLDRDPGAYCFSPREAVGAMRAEKRAERLTTRAGGSGGSRKAPAAEPRRVVGIKYTPRTYRQAVERACRAAGVAHWSPYQLRHLAAGEIDFAHGLDAAQATLGHDKPDTTRRYAKRSFAAAAKVARERG